jgi:CRISPR-associated endonuclease/helicase Cas3
MNVADFDAFFEKLHSKESLSGERVSPFPWQRRLMNRVAKTGWPGVLDLPTSAGKTAAMDIALFHLALEAEKLPQERQAARRVFFVVDRRLVVDEAYERASRIRDRLQEALADGRGILAEVARRLVALAAEDGAEPFEVIRLRGGLPREPAFLRNPLQPAVVLSTVDQVGSRLLFRGYGVSEFMRPIHAALIGIDSLIILDEAHLSRPFMETLQWTCRYQSEAWSERSIGQPVRVVQMTATPSSAESDVLHLEDKDWNHPILGPRLTRTKSAELVTVDGDKDNPEATRRDLMQRLVAEARALMTSTCETCTAPVVGVIVNRVATAREVFEQLRHEEGADAVMLTGRIRPFERDQLLNEYLFRMKAGRADSTNPRPLYVVATQTVEVGADLDFDALVTEAAALDALRQRFGRLNRLGLRDLGRAVIVYVDFGRSSEPDPVFRSVYGDALVNTWKWVEKTTSKPKGKKDSQARKVFDFGIRAMQAVLPQGDELAKLLTPSRPAPVLMPAHVDMLVQTSPRPMVEPEVALYLHGKETQPEDVQIVWRADLPQTLKPEDEEVAITTIAILPPVQLEGLAVPVWVARAWLQGSLPEAIPDVEGAMEAERALRGRDGRYAVRWGGPDDSRLIAPNNIRPGDTIVVPASYGGYDRFGWRPIFDQPVEDIADLAAWQQRGKHVLRVHQDLIPQWFEAEAARDVISEAVAVLEETIARYQGGEGLSELCDDLIERLLEFPHLRGQIRDALTTLQEQRREFVYPSMDSPQGILLQERRNVAREFTDEDDSASLTRQVPLEDHCKGVGALAETFAARSGLPQELVTCVALAAKLHDLGKADPRFQAWLWGGDRLVAKKAGTLLAKSGTLGVNDRFALRIARERAGYPQGARHECYSVAIASLNGYVCEQASDPELVLYLVGVHHGRGRPLMPAVEDEGIQRLAFDFDGKRLDFTGAHGLERLDHGWPERFWRLIRRYGYWGLAYLETLVRLADHRRSEQGQ